MIVSKEMFNMLSTIDTVHAGKQKEYQINCKRIICHQLIVTEFHLIYSPQSIWKKQFKFFLNKLSDWLNLSKILFFSPQVNIILLVHKSQCAMPVYGESIANVFWFRQSLHNFSCLSTLCRRFSSIPCTLLTLSPRLWSGQNIRQIKF